MLEINGLETAYGQSQVLFGMQLSVGEGEVVTLLGRNGAGRTTTLRALLGLTGAVVFGGVGTLAVVAVWWFCFPALRDVDRFDEVRDPTPIE